MLVNIFSAGNEKVHLVSVFLCFFLCWFPRPYSFHTAGLALILVSVLCRIIELNAGCTHLLVCTTSSSTLQSVASWISITLTNIAITLVIIAITLVIIAYYAVCTDFEWEHGSERCTATRHHRPTEHLILAILEWERGSQGCTATRHHRPTEHLKSFWRSWSESVALNAALLRVTADRPSTSSHAGDLGVRARLSRLHCYVSPPTDRAPKVILVFLEWEHGSQRCTAMRHHRRPPRVTCSYCGTWYYILEATVVSVAGVGCLQRAFRQDQFDAHLIHCLE